MVSGGNGANEGVQSQSEKSLAKDDPLEHTCAFDSTAGE